MKLSDFFVPKIARSDPKVRKTAVQEEENVELLQKVIEKDSDEGVRAAARRRLEVLTA